MKTWLRFLISFLAFPLGGIAGELVGPVDDLPTALAGGLVTGAVIGAGQALLSSGRLDPRRWIPATAVGLGLGLALGSAVTGYGTGLSDLALGGALTGLVLGAAQALALPQGRLPWIPAMTALWALGWTVTTVIGVDVERRYTVFGSSGAVTVTALTGLLLALLVPVVSDTKVGEPA